MIFTGDKVRLIKAIPGFERVGEVFQVAGILSGEIDVIQISCGYGAGVASTDEFDNYFSKVRTHPWSAWDNVHINGTVYQYRTNGKRVSLRHGAIKASASCHPLDSFSLEEGIKVCLARISAKEAGTIGRN